MAILPRGNLAPPLELAQRDRHHDTTGVLLFTVLGAIAELGRGSSFGKLGDARARGRAQRRRVVLSMERKETRAEPVAEANHALGGLPRLHGPSEPMNIS